MAERIFETPAVAPPLFGLPLGQARRVARRRAQARVEFKLVDSEEKAFTVVCQSPEAGEALPPSRLFKVDIATRPWFDFLTGFYHDADEENADFPRRFLMVSVHVIPNWE